MNFNHIKNNDLTNFDIVTKKKVHIRTINRNTRKKLTFVEGLENFISVNEIKKLTKVFSKALSCSVSYGKNKKYSENKIIQSQGDHKEYIKSYFIENNIVNEDNIEVHSY